jgi:hypothetical protein
MVQALDLVQADLDASGLADHIMKYEVAGGTEEDPVVNVGWRGTWTGDGLYLDSDDLAEVLANVASEAARGLVEHDGLYWPTCPAHGGRTRARASEGRGAAWMCEQRDGSAHEVALVGQLADFSGFDSPGPLWRTRDQLPSP